MLNVVKKQKGNKITYLATYPNGSIVKVIVFKTPVTLKYRIDVDKVDAETWQSYRDRLEASPGIVII